MSASGRRLSIPVLGTAPAVVAVRGESGDGQPADPLQRRSKDGVGRYGLADVRAPQSISH